MASPAISPPAITPTAPDKFTTPAPVSAGTVALAVLDLLLVAELVVLVADEVDRCVEECDEDRDVVVEFL
jgi:hypothetical protein